MSRVVPLGMPKLRGNSDVIRSVMFTGALKAGCAVSSDTKPSQQMNVVPFDGSKFFGFAVSDLDNTRGVTGVVRKAEAVCLRVKEGEVLAEGNGFAVDNATGELVPIGAADSTPVSGDIEELDITGLDENSNEIPNCVLANVYGGLAPAGSSGGVLSVNGQTGAVTLDATSVGAVEEAPENGAPHGRQDAGWVEVAPKSAAPKPQASEQSSETSKNQAKPKK